MENIILKMLPIKQIKLSSSYTRIYQLKRYYTTKPGDVMKKKNTPHPYRNIHPWKSMDEFSKSLVNGVIYNEGGLVVINKPYGISGRHQKIPDSPPSRIVKEVEYTIADALPHIAEQLGYPSLSITRTPEKYTSGVTLLVSNDNVEKAVEKSLVRAQSMSVLSNVYWVVTTRVPSEISGEKRLAIKMQDAPVKPFKQPIIITNWTINEQKRRDIKLLNVQFNVISNSTGNLSSLIEIKSSTKRWHALRLFAATVLYSPILGDNRYGSRIKNVMGQWMNVSPFVDAAREIPALETDLLDKLRLSRGKETIIPTHLHLREVYLPMFGRKDRNLALIAPPMPEFMWTCQQLQFKHDLFKIDNATEIKMEDFDVSKLEVAA